jgi:lipopolysaccharide transport system permease protein
MANVSHSSYEVRIRPGQNWLKLEIKPLFEFRDLFFLLVQKDFVVKYKQTILGPLWFFIQPVLTTIVFTIIFNRIGGLSTDGLPPMLFYLGGLTLWSYFSQNVNATSNTFGNNAHIFEKVFFPRVIVPLAITVSNLLALGVQLVTLILFILFFKLTGSHFEPRPIAALIFAPLLIIQTGILSLGFGLILSSMTAKYRDIGQLIAFLLQLWMYATPIVYPASRLSEHYRWLVYANPVGPIVENFRGLFLGITSITPMETAASIALTVLLFFAGLLLFQRTQRNFVDTV